MHIADVAQSPCYLGDAEAIPAKPGIAVELANLALSKLNCRLNGRRMPNRRMPIEMECGKVDVILELSHNPQRAHPMPMLNSCPDAGLRLTTLSHDGYDNVNWVVRCNGTVSTLVNSAQS